MVWVRIPLETYFHFEFSLPPRSEQVSGAHVNEMKHDHSPVVSLVVLDPINHIRPCISITAV